MIWNLWVCIDKSENDTVGEARSVVCGQLSVSVTGRVWVWLRGATLTVSRLVYPLQWRARTVQWRAVPCITMQYRAVPCSTVQYRALPCSTVCSTVHYRAQYRAVQYITRQKRFFFFKVLRMLNYAMDRSKPRWWNSSYNILKFAFEYSQPINNITET